MRMMKVMMMVMLAGLAVPWDPLACLQLLQGCENSQQPGICERIKSVIAIFSEPSPPPSPHLLMICDP